MKREEAIKKSIRHWTRLIKAIRYYSKESPDEQPNSEGLEIYLDGETWSSFYCQLCQSYDCPACPLKNAGYRVESLVRIKSFSNGQVNYV